MLVRPQACSHFYTAHILKFVALKFPFWTSFILFCTYWLMHYLEVAKYPTYRLDIHIQPFFLTIKFDVTVASSVHKVFYMTSWPNCLLQMNHIWKEPRKQQDKYYDKLNCKIIQSKVWALQWTQWFGMIWPGDLVFDPIRVI